MSCPREPCRFQIQIEEAEEYARNTAVEAMSKYQELEAAQSRLQVQEKIYRKCYDEVRQVHVEREALQIRHQVARDLQRAEEETRIAGVRALQEDAMQREMRERVERAAYNLQVKRDELTRIAKMTLEFNTQH